MSIRHESIPFVAAAISIGIVCGVICFSLRLSSPGSIGVGVVSAVVLSGFVLYFFRDPDRRSPDDDSLVVSGADGTVMEIKDVREDKYLKTDAVKIGVFLSIFNVHVNRAPITGKSKFIGYFPGMHFFAFREKSSEYNQHNKIFITGKTRCLVNQIVGPLARRVVYWLDSGKEVDVKAGDRIGMMKFGSRLDVYLPKSDVEVLVKKGDKVVAGVTVMARINSRGV